MCCHSEAREILGSRTTTGENSTNMKFAVVPANRLFNYGLVQGPETLDQRLTWKELAALEPRLVALEKQVLDLQRTWGTGYFFNSEW